MGFAISLLVVIGIASIIGTVLRQDETWSDYMIQFGPFWFDVFRLLGLYDVYTSMWYLGLLAFLVASTAVCLYRQTPAVIKQVTGFRDRQQARSLRRLRNHREWHIQAQGTAALGAVERTLGRNRFRFRRRDRGEGQVLVAGMKGWSNRLGYIFTHGAIVVIGIGGLIDGNILLKWEAWRGNLQVETQDDIRVADIDDASRIPVRFGAFQGDTSIPEGQAADVTFVPVRDGYAVQELPFTIVVEEFRIEHYRDGQPRSYESDVVIVDPELDEPLEETIKVNEPLRHRGYSIYQSSFGDGGTELDLRVQPLTAGGDRPERFTATVFSRFDLGVGGRSYQVELDDFMLTNVHPDHQDGTQRRHRNVGPNFTYRLRDGQGRAREFENYMLPIEVDGREFFLKGVRDSPDEPFRYLHVPADDERSMDRFLAFLQNLRERDARREAASDAARQVLANMGVSDSATLQQMGGQMTRTAEGMIVQLLEEGFQAVEAGIVTRAQAGSRDPAQQRLMVTLSQQLLEQTLANAYFAALAEAQSAAEELTDTAELSEFDYQFYDDAIAALGELPFYGAPVLLELEDFDHLQATGLQITRAPGQGVVYTGSALLMLGLFLMFYVPHRRVWALVTPQPDGGQQVLLAGNATREGGSFATEFERLADELDLRLRLAQADQEEQRNGHST